MNLLLEHAFPLKRNLNVGMQIQERIAFLPKDIVCKLCFLIKWKCHLLSNYIKLKNFLFYYNRTEDFAKRTKDLTEKISQCKPQGKTVVSSHKIVVYVNLVFWINFHFLKSNINTNSFFAIIVSENYCSKEKDCYSCSNKQPKCYWSGSRCTNRSSDSKSCSNSGDQYCSYLGNCEECHEVKNCTWNFQSNEEKSCVIGLSIFC